MTQDIARSPLSRQGIRRTYHMKTRDAETLYPSLRGRCYKRDLCRFTQADIQRIERTMAKSTR